MKKNPANNQRLGSAGEINAKALAPTVAVQAYCQIAFYAFAAFLCNSNRDIRIVGFSGCPQYTVIRSIVIIIIYCYEYHDVNNFLCDLFPNAKEIKGKEGDKRELSWVEFILTSEVHFGLLLHLRYR